MVKKQIERGNNTQTNKSRPRSISKPEIEVDYSKPLKNTRYENFSQEVVKDGNATRAAIEAKYSEKGANRKGSQLLTIVDIKNRVAHLKAQISEKLEKETGVDIAMVVKGFKKIAEGTLDKQLTNKNKLRAYENLGKHVGFYKEHNKQIMDPLQKLCEAIDGQTRGLPNDS